MKNVENRLHSARAEYIAYARSPFEMMQRNASIAGLKEAASMLDTMAHYEEIKAKFLFKASTDVTNIDEDWLQSNYSGNQKHIFDAAKRTGLLFESDAKKPFFIAHEDFDAEKKSHPQEEQNLRDIHLILNTNNQQRAETYSRYMLDLHWNGYGGRNELLQQFQYDTNLGITVIEQRTKKSIGDKAIDLFAFKQPQK